MNREFIEDIILEMANIVRENRILKEENFNLRMNLKEYNHELDRSYKKSTEQVANILNAAIEKTL